jgi:hypothetical protein
VVLSFFDLRLYDKGLCGDCGHRRSGGRVMKISMIEALEWLKRLNNYEEILVKTNTGNPVTIDNEIDNIRNFAVDPDELFDLHVTEDSIRTLDENGYIKSGEPLYKVVR